MSSSNMENKDDVFLVIVGDNGDDTFPSSVELKKETLDETEAVSSIDNLLETVEKYGERIDIHDIHYIKKELSDEKQDEMLVEETYYYNEVTDDENVYVPETEDESDINNESTEEHRLSMRKPHEQKSFVDQLRKENVLGEDTKSLIKILSEIMRNLKPPPPPQNFYIMNGSHFECVKCGYMSNTLPAAGRHYQEKHGKRYLVCYACGVDFRSKGNLYKHERRCPAPDAKIVLKARALFLGPKGRSRPFKPREITNRQDPTLGKFACELCSAVFLSRTALQSHEYKHQGLRPFRCDKCPAAYTSNSALTRHRQMHTNVQYICDHCNRSFKIKTALVSHLDTHLPERKHKCEECGKRFAQKFALVLHVNSKHRHLPPPCACPICPKRYPRMSLLKVHMQRKHGMLLMTRKMFYKTLPSLTETEIEKAKVVLKSEETTFLGANPNNILTLKQKDNRESSDVPTEMMKCIQSVCNETENKEQNVNNNEIEKMLNKIICGYVADNVKIEKGNDSSDEYDVDNKMKSHRLKFKPNIISHAKYEQVKVEVDRSESGNDL